MLSDQLLWFCWCELDEVLSSIYGVCEGTTKVSAPSLLYIVQDEAFKLSE